MKAKRFFRRTNQGEPLTRVRQCREMGRFFCLIGVWGALLQYLSLTQHPPVVKSSSAGTGPHPTPPSPFFWWEMSLFTQLVKSFRQHWDGQLIMETSCRAGRSGNWLGQYLAPSLFLLIERKHIFCKKKKRKKKAVYSSKMTPCESFGSSGDIVMLHIFWPQTYWPLRRSRGL